MYFSRPVCSVCVCNYNSNVECEICLPTDMNMETILQIYVVFDSCLISVGMYHPPYANSEALHNKSFLSQMILTLTGTVQINNGRVHTRYFWSVSIPMSILALCKKSNAWLHVLVFLHTHNIKHSLKNLSLYRVF